MYAGSEGLACQAASRGAGRWDGAKVRWPSGHMDRRGAGGDGRVSQLATMLNELRLLDFDPRFGPAGGWLR